MARQITITENSAVTAHRVFVTNDTKRAAFSGVDYGRNIVLVTRSSDAMDIFEANPRVLVFYVPGQDYWAARWRRGYAPAHYLVFAYESKNDGSDLYLRSDGTVYEGLVKLASIPVRMGAKQKS